MYPYTHTRIHTHIYIYIYTHILPLENEEWSKWEEKFDKKKSNLVTELRLMNDFPFHFCRNIEKHPFILLQISKRIIIYGRIN